MFSILKNVIAKKMMEIIILEKLRANENVGPCFETFFCIVSVSKNNKNKNP